MNELQPIVTTQQPGELRYLKADEIDEDALEGGAEVNEGEGFSP